jgi:uncharacterized membrane protein YqaE (UPF0057 family)
MRRMFVVFLAAMVLCTSVNPVSSAIVAPVNAAMPTEPDPAKVRSAVDAFKSLSKKERKKRIKAAKKELKGFMNAKKNGKAPSDNTILLVILAILLPPLAVYLHQGEINTKFWIALLLTILFWLPGEIYA